MARYYYLLASLPDPTLVATMQNFQIQDVQETIVRNLTDQDRHFFKYLLYPNDCHNLINILFKKHEAHRYPAVFDEDYLEKFKVHRYELPDFMQAFIATQTVTDMMAGIEKTDLSEAKVTQWLFNVFYTEVAQLKQRFIQKYFSFDHTIRNILTALNCRNFSLNKREQLLKGEPYFEEILQRNDDFFGLENIFESVPIWQECIANNQIDKLEKSIDASRMWEIDKILKGDAFTSDHVFGYFQKFLLCARWNSLTKERGSAKLDLLINNYTAKAMEIARL